MNLYKVYVMTKKKTGTTTKSDIITVRAESKEDAIEKATKDAKKFYGYKGKVHIGSIFF